jgi:hypothetical protein
MKNNEDHLGNWYFSNDYYPHNPYFNFSGYELQNETLIHRGNCSGYLRQIHNNIIKDVYRDSRNKNKFGYFIRILPYQICLNMENITDKPVKIFIEFSFSENQWFDQSIDSLKIQYFS